MIQGLQNQNVDFSFFSIKYFKTVLFISVSDFNHAEYIFCDEEKEDYGDGGDDDDEKMDKNHDEEYDDDDDD